MRRFEFGTSCPSRTGPSSLRHRPSNAPEHNRGVPGPRANNLNLLRLGAATAVVASHAFQLAGQGAGDPLLAATGKVSIGDAAVWVFFCISGFLVAQSWQADPQPARYAVRRLLRIGPALLVAVGFAMFVVGPLFSDGGPRAYFGDASTWRYASTSLLYWQQYTLPGLFAGNHWGADVNSSLWTLRYELLFYVALPLILLRSRRSAKVSTLAVFACAASVVAIIPDGHELPLPGQLGLRTLAELACFFSAGMLLHLFRERVPMHRLLLCASGAAIVVGMASDAFFFAVPTGLAYAAVYVGTATTAVRLPVIRSMDLSYGVYIYGFIVEQSVVHVLGGAAPPLAVFVISLPVTLLVAAASWRFVEAPALGLKRRLLPRERPRLGASGRPVVVPVAVQSGQP
jgi:peptidoglycan/LPS O-acetylase OafA/YrhL